MIQERQQGRSRFFDELRQAQREEDITAQVNAELVNSSYYAVRRVLCEFRDGILFLRGEVPSYFLKQIAQTVARRGSNGSFRIDNQLKVVY